MHTFRSMVLVACAYCLFSTVTAVAESHVAPEYIGVIAARDPKTGDYVDLERLTPATETKLRFLGFGGGRSELYYLGDKSPVRFRAGQSVEFVLRVERQDIDPQSLIQFWILDSDSSNGRRVLPMQDVASFVSVNARNESQTHQVAFRASKMGSNFFVFKPAEPLAPGEYSVSTTGDKDGFNFGVDP
jgi:hypothetical protein